MRLPDEPAAAPALPAPGLQVLQSSTREVVLVEDLLEPVVPLGEGLVLADVADVEAGEGEEVGAALVAGGEADGADTGAVEDPVGHGGAEEGAETGVRMIDYHLLEMEENYIDCVTGPTSNKGIQS